MSHLRLLPLFLFAAACSSDPELQLSVKDVWGTPVAGATVIQEGQSEHLTTDANGTIVHAVEPGTVRLLASAENYTQDLQAIEVVEGEDPAPVSFTLYPAPKDPGFYGIGEKDYVKLGEQEIEPVASEMTSFLGLKDTPQAKLSKNPGVAPHHRFVFKTNLRQEEIARFDLKLSKLKFVESTTAKAVTGDVEVDLDLWIADRETDFEVKGLSVDDVYLLVTDSTLKPGMYAFHAQNILGANDVRALERLPRELRLAYTFEIK